VSAAPGAAGPALREERRSERVRCASRSFVVLFNGRAGTAGGDDGRRRLAEELARAGARAEIANLGSEPVDALIHRHDPEARSIVVAAGGDGTVRSVAEPLVSTQRILGVLPFGTRNHFARDAGLPLDREGSIRTLLEGRERRVDTGELDGEIFLNNASLGLYPRFVEERRRRNRRTWRGSAIAGSAWWVLRQRRRLRLRVDGEAGETRASIAFVGNNRYVLEGLELGRRESLADGVLSLALASPGGPAGAARLVLRALIGRLADDPHYRHRTAREIRIDTRRSRLRVALDGEPRRFRAPLHFRVRPGSLRLLVPDEPA